MKILMRKPNKRGSELTSTDMPALIRYSMRVRYVALGSALAFTNLPALAEPSCPGIHVDIQNIENSTGTVACALFESPEGFPAEFLHSATHIMMMKIRDTKARCSFLDISPGTYALAVIHDENMDGKLNTNFLGVPTEGFGFSSGAEAGMSAPSFEAARFSYDGGNLDLAIRLSY
ncbi:DUF2141 domain-containing protein [Marinobacter subterrani]|uniref:Putative conserved protein, DUF2141 family n=1 Tax=Marinobacter subterrani TaxID=1658765 RepID=A0A0J7J708_9GAMM|nr:DUF2141 domain-containing protein [Marinobacter subterrani]KMQ74298.1 putative conserved protein, DUF2141 family [Marinobacter subterrani]